MSWSVERCYSIEFEVQTTYHHDTQLAGYCKGEAGGTARIYSKGVAYTNRPLTSRVPIGCHRIPEREWLFHRQGVEVHFHQDPRAVAANPQWSMESSRCSSSVLETSRCMSSIDKLLERDSLPRSTRESKDSRRSSDKDWEACWSASWPPHIAEG